MALSLFITTQNKKTRGVRIVPLNTSIDDLSMFKLLPHESLSLFETKGRKYVELVANRPIKPWDLKLRLDAITAYLKALHE